MEYIRHTKSQPDYPANERHCLYGLDADLIMLSLVTHEPHFVLLREVVSFQPQRKRKGIEHPTVNITDEFQLLHISLVREYLRMEFHNPLPFGFDLERIIDDYVFLCFFIGNDFLPHLPTLEISEGCLDSLLDIYKESLPLMGGYVTEMGVIDWSRAEILIHRIGALERDVLLERAEEREQFEKKRHRRGGNDFNNNHNGSQYQQRSRPQAPLEVAGASSASVIGSSSVSASVDELDDEAEEVSEDLKFLRDLTAMMGEGMEAAKHWYYREKLGIDCKTPQGQSIKTAMLKSYLEGLQWVLFYYYRGVPSWNWFFPFHYAPMASDFVDIRSLIGVAEGQEFPFVLGTPFRPLEQLLGVLPANSCALLPKPYRELMVNPRTSPIIDFYPHTFDIDMQNAKAPWEGVTLVPFIDEERLLAAARSISQSTLSPEEQNRNKFGDPLLFVWDIVADVNVPSTIPNVLPDLMHCQSSCNRYVLPAIPLDGRFQPVLCKGVEMLSAGYPSLTYLRHDYTLRRAGVTVFTGPSKKDSLIVAVTEKSHGRLEDLAEEFLSKSLHLNYPYPVECKVVALSDDHGCLSRPAGHEADAPRYDPHNHDGKLMWTKEAQYLTGSYLQKKGLDIGPVRVLVHVLAVKDRVRNADGAWIKVYAEDEEVVPLQCIITAPVPQDKRYSEEPVSIDEEFPLGSRVVYLGKPFHGCLGTIANNPAGNNPTTVCLNVEIYPEDGNFAQKIIQSRRENWMPMYIAAKQLSIPQMLVSKITGTMLIDVSKPNQNKERPPMVDIGLNLKAHGKRLQVIDFCRLVVDRDGRDQWVVSAACVKLVQSYISAFPLLFESLMKKENMETKDIHVCSLFDKEKYQDPWNELENVSKWLSKQPCAKLPLVSCTSQALTKDTVEAIQQAADEYTQTVKQPRAVTFKFIRDINPGVVFKPGTPIWTPPLAHIPPPFPRLGDRVMNIRNTGPVPFGLRGTVIGMYPNDTAEVLFDEKFIGGSDLYGRCQELRGRMVFASTLLNLSAPFVPKLRLSGPGGAAQAALPPPEVKQQNTQRVSQPSGQAGGRPKPTAWKEGSSKPNFQEGPPPGNFAAGRGRGRGRPPPPTAVAGAGAPPSVVPSFVSNNNKPPAAAAAAIPAPMPFPAAVPAAIPMAAQSINAEDPVEFWNMLQQSKGVPPSVQPQAPSVSVPSVNATLESSQSSLPPVLLLAAQQMSLQDAAGANPPLPPVQPVMETVPGEGLPPALLQSAAMYQMNFAPHPGMPMFVAAYPPGPGQPYPGYAVPGPPVYGHGYPPMMPPGVPMYSPYMNLPPPPPPTAAATGIGSPADPTQPSAIPSFVNRPQSRDNRSRNGRGGGGRGGPRGGGAGGQWRPKAPNQ
eukprot:GILK01014058.1.p1 GENE.GILK01014058.1~~GILK01014058.1.p1  ORF type:complete len:1454 (+),score=268.17 GILK01014058.1:274-4362(+)